MKLTQLNRFNKNIKAQGRVQEKAHLSQKLMKFLH